MIEWRVSIKEGAIGDSGSYRQWSTKHVLIEYYTVVTDVVGSEVIHIRLRLGRFPVRTVYGPLICSIMLAIPGIALHPDLHYNQCTRVSLGAASLSNGTWVSQETK